MKTQKVFGKPEPLCNRNQQKFCRDMMARVNTHDIARKQMNKVKPSNAVRKAYKIVNAFNSRQSKMRERVYRNINSERAKLQAAIAFAPASKALAMAQAFYDKYKT